MHGISYYKGDGSVFDMADKLRESLAGNPEGGGARQRALAELAKEANEHMIAAMEMDWEEEQKGGN